MLLAVAGFQSFAQKPVSKLTKAAGEIVTKDSMYSFIVTAKNLDSLLVFLKEWQQEVAITAINRQSKSIVIHAGGLFVKNYLLPLDEIIFIDLRQNAQAETGIIGYNRGFHGISAIDHSIPGANGKNIVASVKEQKPESADLDIFKRVLNSSISGTVVSNHATVIASIIGGAGNSFYDGRGIAWNCKFFPSSFDNLFADDETVLNDNHVTVQNHSYGTIIQQFYGAEALSYDAQTWQNKTLVAVFSAGNKGALAAGEGTYANIPGFANLSGNFKMAKNIISVGATDNAGNIAGETSVGPAYDGRLAPQLLALGPNGTSDAAAMVSGTVAVMQQVYADSNADNLPPASLIKSILYNTADDVHARGIDYKTGYGLLNSFEAVNAIIQKQYDSGRVSQAQTWTKIFSVPAGAARLQLTLAWTDTAAPINNSKALINDLDLELVQMNSGTVYKPWVLSTAANADSLNKLPVRKRDSLNTAEQLSLELPAAGNYRVTVHGTSLQTASLPFHIAYRVDTLNKFQFTHPQHASDVNRAENEELTIRWKTFVADTNQTGSLHISYNNGSTWNLLDNAVKIYRHKFLWPVKDTAATAMLKMETTFGNFLSKPFIISPVTRLQVDFLCTDSFRLSWKPHIYAGSYKIFAMADSAYLKPIANTTDTFAVFNRSQFPYTVYAVEPVTGNGLGASRSIAADINLQGVSCFYKTFYYELLDGNVVKLNLELSTLANIDSIGFEKISPGGQLIQSFSASEILPGQLLYHHVINGLTAGNHYFRVCIRLKNGLSIYTDIAQVLVSGQQLILFYPNPANRAVPLKYILQQGILQGSTGLLLYDAAGRLLADHASIPDLLDISGFSPGIYVYRLIRSGKAAEIGKILVQ